MHIQVYNKCSWPQQQTRQILWSKGDDVFLYLTIIVFQQWQHYNVSNLAKNHCPVSNGSAYEQVFQNIYIQSYKMIFVLLWSHIRIKEASSNSTTRFWFIFTYLSPYFANANLSVCDRYLSFVTFVFPHICASSISFLFFLICS